jgi:hypothetical protein
MGVGILAVRFETTTIYYCKSEVPQAILDTWRATRPMITWDSYFQRVSALHMEFRLAGEAIHKWAHSQEALDHYAHDQLEDLRGIFREASKGKGDQKEEGWVFADEKRINEYLEAVRKEAPRKVEEVAHRLLQHEYILHVSIFETFLKSIHREILRANPTLLRADRTIELGRLVAQGQETILAAEIEREISALDREAVDKKYKYFRDKLGINWFDGKATPLLDKVIRWRNIMLHENPDLGIGNDNLALLSLMCTAIVFATVAGAAVLYPDVCALPERMTAKEAELFVYRKQ